MDPVSIASLVASSVQLAELALKIGKGLHEYRERYGQAGRTLKSIVMYCNAVNSSILMVKDWIQNTVARSLTREQQVESLSTMIEEFLEMMALLEAEVDKLLGKETSASDLHFKTKAKFAWNERLMKEHLEEINCLASALHLLLDATKLSVHDSQKLLESLADNAASIGSTRRSLLSTSLDGKPDARFAFDDTLLSSHVYRKTHLLPPFLHGNDDSSAALSIAQEAGTLWFTADESLSSDGTVLRRAQSMDILCHRSKILEGDPCRDNRPTQVQSGEEIASGCTPIHVEPLSSVSAESDLDNPWRTKTCLRLATIDEESGFQALEFLTTLTTKIAEIEQLEQGSPALTEPRPLWHYFDYFLGLGTSAPLVVLFRNLDFNLQDMESSYRKVVNIAIPKIAAAHEYDTMLRAHQSSRSLPGYDNFYPLLWKAYKLYLPTEYPSYLLYKPWQELWSRSGEDLSINSDQETFTSGTLATIARNGTSSVEGWSFNRWKLEPLFGKSVEVSTRQELLKSEFNIFDLADYIQRSNSNKTRRARLRDSITGALGLKKAASRQLFSLSVQSEKDRNWFDVDGTTPNPKRDFSYNYTDGRFENDGPDLPTLLKERLVDVRRRREKYDPERWQRFIETRGSSAEL